MKTLQHTGTVRNGYLRKGGARFAFLNLIFLFFLSAAHAETIELSEISRLAKSGASQLALTLLEQHQPEFSGYEKQWLSWERVRVRIMQKHARWQDLAQRIDEYPEDLPEAFLRWSEVHQVSALINAGDYVEARNRLRALIWRPAQGDRLLELRHLVMQSYLEQGRINDAHAAMLRFHQDYGEQEESAILLRARVLLAAGRAGESYALLQRNASGAESDALKALAELRSGGDAAVILKLARSNGIKAEEVSLRWLWFGVMAEAAVMLNNRANLIIALERLLPLLGSSQLSSSEKRLFSFTTEQLWKSYLAYADKVGNHEQLLVGDDQAWLKAAQKTEPRYPIRKRALYVQLAERGAKAELREQGHQAFVELLLELKDEGKLLVERLYLQSERYNEAKVLPKPAAYHLVDEAIKRADLALASNLLQQLPQPPGGTERFVWQMRRAKVFLLAGDYVQADTLLTGLMPHTGALSEKQRDQVVQLLFDLQNVGEHERAYRLLKVMFDVVPGLKLRRELLFWMADSRKAQGAHAEAARLYLRSATLGDNKSMDPWAQTARYQAAKSLVEANLSRDALHIYSLLLKVTESPERRSVLRHELQQLKLRGERS